MAAFARYDGIDGESKDAQHDNWVDVLSLDWGVHRPGTGSTGQSRRRGSAVVEDLVVNFEYEKAAPKLLERCLRGHVIPKLDIELTATFGGARVTYLKYELKNVMVTSYQVNASGNDEAGPPTVSIANSFGEITVTYTEFDSSGRAAGYVVTTEKFTSGRSGRTTADTAGDGTNTKKKKKK